MMTKVQTMLTESITRDCVALWMQETAKPLEIALKDFYTSQVFCKLSDWETGLYSQASAYVYDLFRDEMSCGRIVQNEI